MPTSLLSGISILLYTLVYNDLTHVCIYPCSYHFKKVADLKDCAAGTIVDVLGVVKHASDVQELVSTKRGGVQLHKRELLLMDDSNHEVRLTLWG